jgi:hypothetical protein
MPAHSRIWMRFVKLGLVIAAVGFVGEAAFEL